MEYNKQSLYTKYRPMTFDQVVGQEVSKKILTNSILENKINHAYLFYGIRGTGKTTLARIFAKAINCQNKQDANPCNECDICKDINNGSSFDVIEIDAASNNGVDEMRSIKENTNFLTKSANYKVYIIDEVHMLTKQAFNALLKTLEEPPQNTIFLLATTELHKIPQTVLSRTIVINLEVMSESDIIKGLEVVLQGESIKYDKEALKYLEMTSGGSLRDGISALETTLLYNNELSLENTIKALGLIQMDVIRDLLLNNVEKLIDEISKTDKDPRKLTLIILEVIMQLIKDGENKYVNVLNSLIEAVNSIKDPSLLKIALKTAFYSVNVPRETIVEKVSVSRETLPETPILQEQNVESVEKVVENNQNNDISTNNNNIENVEKVVENGGKPMENIPTETPKNIDKNTLNIITDYADVNNYMYIIKKNSAVMLEKAKNRWKFKDNYITNPVFKHVVSSLVKTIPLASTEKTIILGFQDETLINEFKRLSLTKDYFEFIKELMGSYMFILPIDSDKWSKLLAVKDNTPLSSVHSDLSINYTDFLTSKEEETINNVNNLFGKGNVSMNRKIREITEKLRELPGVSLKLAERLAISIAENPELGENIGEISQLTKDLSKDPLTGLIIDKNEVPNENKDKDILLIVDSNRDVNNIIEKTNTTKSIFILGMENKRDFDSTQKVLDRLFKVVEMYNTKEILFLLSPSIESELIMRVVKEEIVNTNLDPKPKLTRLSMGIPFGGSIEFSDERTIKEAMSKREEA